MSAPHSCFCQCPDCERGRERRDSCTSELAAPAGSDRLIHWSTFKPTEASTATQLWMQDEVLGLYWHLPEGFKRTGGKKVYQTEKEIRLAMVRSALQRTFFREEILREEITRLNDKAGR